MCILEGDDQYWKSFGKNGFEAPMHAICVVLTMEYVDVDTEHLLEWLIQCSTVSVWKREMCHLRLGVFALPKRLFLSAEVHSL